jgi:hypothetical protein
MKVYSIYDKKALTYGPLMCFPQDVMAIRAVSLEVQNNPKSPIGAYPHDFCLLCVGEFEETTGNLYPREINENVFECVNALRKEEQA